MTLMQRRRALMTVQDNAPDLLLNDIFTLDGIENTGAGHSDNTATWVDISGNNNSFNKEGNSSNLLWGSDHAIFDGTYRKIRKENSLISEKTALTLEMVAQVTGNGSTIYQNHYYGMLFTNRDTSASSEFWVQLSTYDNSMMEFFGQKVDASSPVYLCATFDGTYRKVYINGQLISTTERTLPSSTNNQYAIGGFARYNDSAWRPNANIYRIGMSGYAMAEDEIAQRYAKFRRRFNF